MLARYQSAGEVRSALETLGFTSGEIAVPGLDSTGVGSRKAVVTWVIVGLATLFAVLLAANSGGLRERLFRQSTTHAVRSLAVLPLANLSGDPSQDFFADGMTAELIGKLSKIGDLRVVSRTSVMGYKGAHKPLPQISPASMSAMAMLQQLAYLWHAWRDAREWLPR